jgi:hypothetical protein
MPTYEISLLEQAEAYVRVCVVYSDQKASKLCIDFCKY